MLKAKEYLPVGTVVSLIGGTKRAMIIGIIQSSRNADNKYTEHDYIGVIYPEGFLSTDTMFLFNHDQIEEVAFRGYEDPERDSFIERLGNNTDIILKIFSEREKKTD